MKPSKRWIIFTVYTMKVNIQTQIVDRAWLTNSVEIHWDSRGLATTVYEIKAYPRRLPQNNIEKKYRIIFTMVKIDHLQLQTEGPFQYFWY